MKLLRWLPRLLLISALVLGSEARNHFNCPEPPTLPNTWRTGAGCYFPFTKNEICEYRCRPGYPKVSGNTYRTCFYGRWTGDDLVCSRDWLCPTPPTPPNTYRSGCSMYYTQGKSCTYRCRPGYTQVSGSTVRTCSNKAWTGTDLVCTGGRNCTTPPNPENSNAYITGCSYPYTNGEKCYYRCRPGYMRVIGDKTRSCYIHWTGTSLFCVKGPNCRAPPTPAYTNRSGCSSPYTYEESCTYQCRDGYEQVDGNNVRTCYHGRWTGKELFCSDGQNCPTPPYLPYTKRSNCSSPYNNGESCSYQCRPGFIRVIGSTSKTCNNGAWTGANLVCRREPKCPIRRGTDTGGTHVWRCFRDEHCWFGQKCCSNGFEHVCMNPVYYPPFF